MNMYKDPESWSKVSAEVVMDGSKSQCVNVMKMALDDIQKLAAERGVVPPALVDALEVMFMAWDAETTRAALHYIGLGGDMRFPLMLRHSDVSSIADARAVLAKYQRVKR